MQPKFSVVMICRNEAKTLPRLMESLKEFQARGGEVIVVDTGSTDGTPELARYLGCVVEEVGDRFRRTLTHEDATAMNEEFVDLIDVPAVKEGDAWFHFSEARNYAASLAENEWIAMPDADEQYTVFDIDKIEEAMAGQGVTRLRYDFSFAPTVHFQHSKIYRRDVHEWRGAVHECLFRKVLPVTAAEFSADERYVDDQIIKLDHFQQPSDHRSSYLTGLLWAMHSGEGAAESPDRAMHYAARELLYTGRYRSAINLFREHIDMSGWQAECAQSAIFAGDASKCLGNNLEAARWYHEACRIDPMRREPFCALGQMYQDMKDYQQSAIYFSAALQIPYHGGYYATDMGLYQERTPLLQSVNMYYLGSKKKSKSYLQEAYDYAPNDELILENFKYVLDFPPVTIMVPTVDRDTSALEQSLADDKYPGEKEIMILKDERLIGCPRMVNRMVQLARHDFVVFLGDDTVVTPHWLTHAMIAYDRTFMTAGLVALNDGIVLPDWNPKLACHWLAHRNLNLLLKDRQFFHESLEHYGCDDFLTAQAQRLRMYTYAHNAVIHHNHPADATSSRAESFRGQDTETLKQLLLELH